MRRWLVAALVLASPVGAVCQVPYRKPVYSEALWLPEGFLPAGFTADPDKALFSNPLRSNGTQGTAIQVERPSGTGTDRWIWCFIDGMTLHQSVADAKAHMAFYVSGDPGGNSAWRRVSMGDEAYIDENRVRGYLGQKDVAYSEASGFLIKENIASGREGGAIANGTVWRRNLLVDPIRIGRMTVGLRVEGHAVSQVVNGKWAIIRPTPTGEELVDIAGKFVAAIDAYARSQGWVDGKVQPGTIRVADSGQPMPPTASTETGAPTADATSPPDTGIAADAAAVSLGTVAAGALTALGAGLMMLGMGVSPWDVIEGARELFGGASPEAVAREAPTEEQRGAAARIWTEGWTDVTSQEQELIRTSPEWLRGALKARFPAQAIEGYQRSWKEDVAGVVTPVLKVAQSGCDLAVGVFSKVSPGFGVSYTMFKNMAGGISEGVHDWWWGSNDKGLVRNVTEGFTRGGLKGGVETAVDLAAGKLLGHVGGKYAMDPNNVGWKEFPWREALADVTPEYFAGQAGKYGVGRVGDMAVDAMDPPSSKGRPLRAEGFFDTTSPLEKDALDCLFKGESGLGAPVPQAARLPYLAQNLVQ